MKHSWILALALTLPVGAQESVPMHYLPGSEDGLIHSHLFWVPVKVGDHEARFVLDTGIGVHLISSDLARKLRCPETGISHKGQRMSGQQIEVPLSYVSSLTVGSKKQAFVTTGVWDFAKFLPRTGEFATIEGFLGLRFFQHTPFTLDYRNQRLILETPESLAQRQKGAEVALEMDDSEGVSLTAFAQLDVEGAGPARVEVDTGSDSLILHRRLMRPLGVREDGPDVKVVRAKDETDHEFTRYFSALPGSVSLGGLRSPAGRVMFQDIRYDGLIGDALLKNYAVTFDLAHSRMWLNRP